MYNAAQLLTKIEALYDKVERAQSALTLASLNGEPDKERKAVAKLEELYARLSDAHTRFFNQL